MIKVRLKRLWHLIDGSSDNAADVPVDTGTYELERIPNPFGHTGNWLVLKGTKIGMGEKAWKQWINGVKVSQPGHPDFGMPIDHGNLEIVLEEDGQLISPPQD